MWDEPRNQHLFMSSNLNAAQHLLDLLVTYDLTMLLPTGIPTLEANVSGNHTRPDNVFGSHLADMIISCNVAPEIRPTETDHYPIVTTLLLDPARMHPPPKRNYRMTNWEKFTKHLENQLVQLETQPSETEIPSAHTLENRLSGLTKAIENTIAKHVPLSKPSPYSKCWWTAELDKESTKVKRLQNGAFDKCQQHTHPIHAELKKARNSLSGNIRKAKEDHWSEYLKNVDSQNI